MLEIGIQSIDQVFYINLEKDKTKDSKFLALDNITCILLSTSLSDYTQSGGDESKRFVNCGAKSADFKKMILYPTLDKENAAKTFELVKGTSHKRKRPDAEEKYG